MTAKFRRYTIILCLAVAALLLYWHHASQPTFYIGGIQTHEPDSRSWMKALKASGMNTVSITSYALQGAWDSDDLREDTSLYRFPTFELQAAQAAGLEIIMIPRVHLIPMPEHNQHIWHGMIMPATDEQLHRWFSRYRNYMLRWARLAEVHDVAVLAVGSELNTLSATLPAEQIPGLPTYYMEAAARALEGTPFTGTDSSESGKQRRYAALQEVIDHQHLARLRWAESVTFSGHPASLAQINRRRKLLDEKWRELIAAVREEYSGKLTYAANFDNYREVGFWDVLDFIGINAYFPIRSAWEHLPADSLQRDMFLQWQGFIAEIDTFRVRQGVREKQVIFTELGYPYRRRSTLAPWSGEGLEILHRDGLKFPLDRKKEPLDFQERAMAMTALYDANDEYQQRNQKQFLSGLLYWKFTTRPFHLQYEPYLAYLGRDSRDPMLPVLRRFGGDEQQFWDSDYPAGETGTAADSLARLVAQAMALKIPDSLRVVSWSMDNGYHYLWDIENEYIQVRWDDFKALLDFTYPDHQSRLYQGGKLIDAENRDRRIRDAWRAWARDAFWLYPFARFFDPGCERRIISSEEPPRLMTSFFERGTGVGDRYLWELNERNQPVTCLVWSGQSTRGGLPLIWQDSRDILPGVTVPHTYKTDAFSISLHNIKFGSTVSSLLEENPFSDFQNFRSRPTGSRQ